MHIEHIGLWVRDIELMREFYERYFGCSSGELYYNRVKEFQSYFLTFEDGARLELMTKPGLWAQDEERFGLAHVAFALGSEEAVDSKVRELLEDGYPLVDGPRVTGDGYYEAVMTDPEGNLVELTV